MACVLNPKKKHLWVISISVADNQISRGNNAMTASNVLIDLDFTISANLQWNSHI